MKGFIWPSKNKKNGTISRRSSSASGVGQTHKSSSSGGRQLSPSVSSVVVGRDNNGSSTTATSVTSNASASTASAAAMAGNVSITSGKRKSSSTFSLRKQSSDNISRSSGTVYMSDIHSVSGKSTASSIHKNDDSSLDLEIMETSPDLDHEFNRSIASENDTLVRDPTHGSFTSATGQSNIESADEHSMDAATKFNSKTPTDSSTINRETYDNLVLKTGWINKSHGLVLVNSNTHIAPSQNNDNPRNNHRDSRIYNSEISENMQDSQISVPDYKLYRAQLKGPILNLYKSGLHNNVKNFDPSLAETKNDATPNNPSSAPNSANSPYQPKASKAPLSIKYLNERYPHPELKLDENRKVVSGSIESLCHAVLFSYPDDYDSKCEKYIINLLLILPLIDNFIKFLQVFNQFGLTFTKHTSQISNNSAQFHNISASLDTLMTERLGLVVKVILDIFPSFLLDDAIFQATIKLLDTISLHNDEISNNLKFYVADKHNRLSKLTSFTRSSPSKYQNSGNSGNGNHDSSELSTNNDNTIGTNSHHSHHLSNHRLLDDILSVEQFLMLDTSKLANEVHSINLKFDKKWAPRLDYSLLYDSKYINNNIVALNPLVFNNNHNVHFLGRLLICHLFPSNRSPPMSPKLRAKVLTKWIEFGGMFEKLGDMVSWLAVATIICSVPILRLYSSWKYVPDQTIKILFKDWIPTIAQLDRRQMSLKSTSSVFILAPPNLNDPFIRSNVISYFGDLIIHADNLPASSKFKYLEKKINRTKNAFYKWQQRLDALNSDLEDSHLTGTDISPESSRIYQFWKYHLSQPAINVEVLMQMSLKHEPPRINQKIYSTIGSKRSPLSSGGYLPVLFNDLFPMYTLFSKTSLIAASGALPNENGNKDSIRRSKSSFNQARGLSTPEKVDPRSIAIPVQNSEASQITGLSNIDAPLVKELSLKQSNRQRMLKCIRDAFNIESDIFHVSDDLIFKSLTDMEARSPTTSVVIETPKRFSQQSSNNGTLAGLQDSHDSSNRLSRTLENMDFFSNIGHTSATLNESLINVVLKSGSLDKVFDILVLTASIFSKFIDNKDLEKYYHNKKQRDTPRSKNSHNHNLENEENMGLLDYAFVKLTMDMDIFTTTFFNSYKSFTTTTVVLENIARRYIGAKGCALCISQLLSSNESKVGGLGSSVNEKKFPVWDAKISEDEKVNPSYWVKIQIGAAEAILSLVKSHYSDFTDDLASHSTVLDILKIMEQDVHIEWPSRISNLQDTLSPMELKEIEENVASLDVLFNEIKITYQKQLYRPLGVNRNSRKVTTLLESFKPITLTDYNLLIGSNSLSDPLIHDFRNLRHNKYEEILKWINSFDNFISEKLMLVTPQDWFSVYQVLESVSHESLTALFSFPMRSVSYSIITSGNSQLDELSILDVFTWLSTLMIKTEQGDVSCLGKLPESVQLLVKLHRSLTNFFLVEISDIKKAIYERIETCTVLLQILNYVRWKNSSLDLFQAEENYEPDKISPHIPSFVETAINNAITAPKSRFFEHAWDAAHDKLSSSKKSETLSSVCDILDDIDDMHIKSFIEIDGTLICEPKNLSPCPGWVTSRLLEISQFVPNMSIMNSKLINFDKRRFVNNIISNSSDLVPHQNNNKEREDRFFGTCLFHNFSDPSKNYRKIARSNAQSEIKALRYQVRGIFNEILVKEVEKIKRDQKKIEVLIIQERDNKRSVILQQVMQRKSRNSIAISNDQNTSQALQSFPKSATTTSSPSWNSSRDKRSSVASFNSRGSTTANSGHNNMGKKLGGFFKRPFSIGGFNSSASTNSLSSILVPDVQDNGSVSPYNLPLFDSLSVLDQKPAYSLKTFEIKSILEIMNHKNAPGYMFCFKIIMLDSTEFIIQTTSAADMAEWIKTIKLSKRYSFHSKKYKGKTHNKVFGVPLEDVCEREGTMIPSIVVKLLEEIELRGLDEVGLYRIPGSVGSVNALKNAFDEEGAVNNSFTLEDERWYEINAIAGCFKMYLRELPDCLFSNENVSQFSDLFLKLKTSEISQEEYTRSITSLLQSLPACYYQTMRRIVLHLNKVHQHVNNNRMDASNLSIVFSMSFIDQDDLASSMGSTLGSVQSILQQFITAPELYFT